MPRGRAMYDDDDFDYDDDGYYDEEDAYGEYDEAPATKQQKAPAASHGQKKLSVAQPTTAAKTTKQAQSSQPHVYPVAPNAPPAFDFSTPSPDDRVMNARLSGGRTTGVKVPAPPVIIPEAGPSQTSAPQHTIGSASGSSTPSNAMAAMAAMSLRHKDPADGGSQSSHIASTSASQPAALQQRRKVSEYVMEHDLAREVEALQAQESVDGRHPLHLVVLGHVDAGKSTLMGRLLHDLGRISDREAHKNLKEATQMGKASFAWAWVLDERQEERSRGVTVDVAQARFTTHRFNVTLLDAPGHRDFVPNMIGGASQADAALLLVDGSLGGFEAGFMDSGGDGGGQTKEHAQLARSLGVEQVAVVISKLDTCSYSQDRFLEVQSQLLPFLKSCGFKENALQWLPAVGPTGENLVSAPAAGSPLAAWWKGPTVVEAVDNFSAKERSTSRPLRIPVADVLKGKSGSVTAGGKVEGGALKVGSKVVVWPAGELATVKSLEVDGKASQVAYVGNSVDVVLAGMELGNISTGSMICHPEYPVMLATKFEARILVLDVAVPLLKGQSVTVHAHSARESGHICALVNVLNPKTGAIVKTRPRCLVKGQTAVVEVSMERSLCVEQCSDYKALGRVALRTGGRTIAVGVVVQVFQ